MSKITKQNVGGTDYTMVGCALTGVCASAADAFIKAVTLSDGDEISDGMTVIVTFANGNTAGTAPASKTIYSSDQENYYEDTGLTVPFTLAPAGCYEITYTGEGNAYTYISYPVIQIGNITGILCDASGNTVSGSLWAKGAQVGIMFKDGKFLLVSGALLNNMSALPTDAVLHYSFDDLPDYPDGTAVEKYIKDFTSVPTNWSSVNYGVLTVSNGELINTVTNGTTCWIRRYYSSTVDAVIKIKIKATKECTITIAYYNATSSQYEVITALENAQAGQDYVLTGYIPRIDYVLIKAVTPTATDFQLILSEYYVGDGSYATPIIDNANGQNNGTNNGGLAVKGVSGKGVRFSGKGVIYPNNNIGEKNKTFSCWFSIDNIIFARNIFCKNYNNGFIVIVRNVNNVSTLSIFYYSAGYTNIAQLTANTVYHLVIICGETDIKVYLNGVLVKTINVTVVDNINRLFIGALTSDASSGFYGTIDDFLVFNRALSEAEVTALYLNRANTPKFYDLNNYELQDIQPSFGCPRGGTYTLNRLTKQSIGKLNIYAGSVTFGADASGGNMYLNIDGLINTNADACFSQWTIKDVNSGYLDLSASTSIWVRIGIASNTYLQTADCAGKTMDFILITMPK